MRANLDEELGTSVSVTTIILAVLLAFFVILAVIFGVCACKLLKKEKSGAEEPKGRQD